MMAVRGATSGAWSVPLAISPPFAQTLGAAFTSGRIGEYQALTAIDPTQYPLPPGDTSTFYAAWSEIDPAGTNVDRISGTRIMSVP